MVRVSRRTWLRSTAAGCVSAAAARVLADPLGFEVRAPIDPRSKFGLKYAPHFGMFRHHAGDDPVKQLEWMNAQGFTAIEDNGMAGRSVDEQKRIAEAMERLGMEMGVFVVNGSTGFGRPTFTSGDEGQRGEFLESCKKAVEVAGRVRARWMTVVLGDYDHRLHPEVQTVNAIETLKRAAAVFEPHGLVMVLEPLNELHDHPGQFLTRSTQAYLICKAVESPSCKILFDMYHQQITEGNLIPNIDRLYDEIGYFQVGDNPGRREPGTGEVNYRNIFRHLKNKDYAGILGMEHGNARDGKEGELAVVEAYRRCDEQ